MKVCIVSQQCGEVIRNGVGTYAHLLIRGLLEKGVDLRLVTTEKMDLDIDQTVVEVRLPDPTPSKWLSTSYSVSRSLAREALDEMDVDIVHFLDAREALFIRDLGVPLIGTQHDFYSLTVSSNLAESRRHYPDDWCIRIPYYMAARTLESKVLRRLDAVIAVCDYTGRQITEGFGVDEGKVFIVYNGFTPDSRADASRAYHERENRILFIAGNLQRKNLALLLKALPLIIHDVPDVRLTILGADKHGDMLTSSLVDDSVRDVVEFLGIVPHDEVLRLMSTSKVFAMPSLYESFAFVYLEAMSHGLPVIAGRIGGAPELVREGIDGYIVDAGEVEYTAYKVSGLLLDEERWTSFSKNCLDRVGYFSAARMVDGTIDVYGKVIDGAKQ